jgi:hypothetical protein
VDPGESACPVWPAASRHSSSLAWRGDCLQPMARTAVAMSLPNSLHHAGCLAGRYPGAPPGIALGPVLRLSCSALENSAGGDVCFHEPVEGKEVAVYPDGVGLHVLFAVSKHFRHGIVRCLERSGIAFTVGLVDFVGFVIVFHERRNGRQARPVPAQGSSSRGAAGRLNWRTPQKRRCLRRPVPS